VDFQIRSTKAALKDFAEILADSWANGMTNSNLCKEDSPRYSRERGRWYVAYIEEIPGINTQGRTLAEARRNLRKAFQLILEANRQL
jgi:predicted RNase H-like HicB family nuclease